MSDPAELATDVTMTRRQVQERALRGSLWALVNVVVTLPLAILVNAVVARMLGPSEYGRLAFLLTALTMALPLTELGFGQALAQWGVASELTRDTATTDLLLRSRLGFVLCVQLPLLLLGGLLVLGAEPWWVFAAFMASMLVSLLGAGAHAVLLIQNRSATVAKLTMVVAVAVQIGVLIGAVAFADAGAVWSIRVVVSIVGPIMAFALVSSRFRRVTLRPRLPRGLPAGFWRFALFSWVAVASGLLVYSRSEVFVLRFYDEVAELGLFALAFGLSQQLTVPVDSLLAPLFPANAALVAGHPDDIRFAFLRSIRFFSLLSGALLCLAAPIVFFIPLAFGDAFRDSQALFVPLGVMSTFQSATSAVTLVTFARRRGSALATTFVVALVLDIAVAVALVPAYGAWGAVVANVVGQLVSIVMLTRLELRVQRTRLGEVVAAGRAWGFGLAGLGIGVVAGGLAERAGGPLTGLAAAAAASVASFLLLLRFTGGVLTPRDSAALLDVLPRSLQRLADRALSWAEVGDGAATKRP